VNEDIALECAECGRQLMSEAALDASIAPVEGLEIASYAEDTAITPDEGPIAGLELTHYAPARVAVAERVAVEPTRLEDIGEVLPDPTPADFESGREQDDGVRTPDPESSAICPWCKAPSTSKVCDSCGRRRSRYTAPAGLQSVAARRDDEGDKESCPNCFGRISWAARCSECGIALPPR
jgi:hypothetical protein